MLTRRPLLHYTIGGVAVDGVMFGRERLLRLLVLSGRPNETTEMTPDKHSTCSS